MNLQDLDPARGAPSKGSAEAYSRVDSGARIRDATDVAQKRHFALDYPAAQDNFSKVLPHAYKRAEDPGVLEEKAFYN